MAAEEMDRDFDPAGPIQRLALFTISMTQLMITVDGTVVNTAIGRIQAGLRIGEPDLQWVVSAYTLTYGGLLLLGGRSGDLFGRKRVLQLGVILFGLGSLAAAAAPSASWFFVARGLQGVGAAFSSPTALALISTQFPGPLRQRRAMGWYVTMSYAGAGIGLVGGGLLTTIWGWRSVFLLNLPLVAAIVVAGHLAIRETPRRMDRLDAKGALLGTLGLIIVGYGLSIASKGDWLSAQTLVALVIGLICLGLFLRVERRAEYPLLDLGIFRTPGTLGAYATFLMVGAAMSGWFLFTTLFMQDIFGYSPLQSGIAWLPVTVVIIVLSRLTPRLLGRVRSEVVILSGLTLIFVGIALIGRLAESSNYAADIMPAIVVTALGIGVTFLPLTLLALQGVPESRAGMASGAVTAVQQVGGGIGVAALSVTIAIFAPVANGSLSESFAVGLRGAACCALIALIIAVLSSRRRGVSAGYALGPERSPPGQPDAPAPIAPGTRPSQGRPI